MTKPILVLLPGLDGSGELFAPLVAKLAETVDTRIVRLPLDGEQTQRALAQRLLPLLPSEPFALLAESFSGAVALELARLKPAGLQQLILVATFLRPPRPLFLKFALPLVGIAWRWHRQLASLWWPFCGYVRDSETRARVMAALRYLTLPVLRARLHAIQTLNTPTDPLTIPVHVIHAGNDRLLPVRLRKCFNSLGDGLIVPGPHFLLQSEPGVMAELLRERLTLISPETG